MSPNDADGMANSEDPDQTAPLEAVWSGSALFTQAYLSKNLGSLQNTQATCPSSFHAENICKVSKQLKENCKRGCAY